MTEAELKNQAAGFLHGFAAGAFGVLLALAVTWVVFS
jgi:hypothetical protein